MKSDSDERNGVPLSKEAYLGKFRSTYAKFFEDMSYSNTRELQLANLDTVEEIYTALGKIRNLSCLPVNVVRACCAFAAMVCKLNTFENKVKVAHYTAVCTELDNLMSSASMREMDDGGEVLKEDCALFYLKFCNPAAYERLHPTRGNLHAVLEELIVFLQTDMNPFFPTQSRHHNTLITGTLRFVEGCILEYEYSESAFEVTPEMSRLPAFVRAKSGISEVFILFVLTAPHLSDNTSSSDFFFYEKIYPMLPELVAASDHINDILSFYKELDDEDDGINYIASCAKVRQITPFEAFVELMNQVINIRKNVMAMVEKSGSAEVKKAVTQYFQGYISWHLAWHKRYRLTEIFGDDWYEGVTL